MKSTFLDNLIGFLGRYISFGILFYRAESKQFFGVSASLKGLIDGGLKELLGIIILYQALTPCCAEDRRYVVHKSNENN